MEGSAVSGMSPKQFAGTLIGPIGTSVTVTMRRAEEGTMLLILRIFKNTTGILNVEKTTGGPESSGSANWTLFYRVQYLCKRKNGVCVPYSQCCSRFFYGVEVFTGYGCMPKRAELKIKNSEC